MRVLALLFLFTVAPNFISCWKSFEPDLFDLVEEVGKNFYEFFEVPKNADAGEIRKAYRKLSLKWHPDKNTEANAENMFRQIVGINEVLKDEEKRKRYNEILEFGLPDWKQPVYYYRRARKLNFLEILMTMAIVIVIGHYFVMWAQYFERKLCLDEYITETRKRIEKKQKKKNKNFDMGEIDKKLEDAYDALAHPSLKNTLPVRLVVLLYNNKLFIPALISIISKSKSKQTRTAEEIEIEEAEKAELENQKKIEEADAKRRRLVNDLNPKKIETSSLGTPVVPYKATDDMLDNRNDDDDEIEETKENKVWTDGDKASLIKAITRYPGGTTDRWNKISKFVGKPVRVCIDMEKQLRSSYQAASSLNKTIGTSLQDQQLISDNIMTMRDNETSDNEQKQPSQWSQDQQKQLENALKSVDKNAADRWERIANLVPGKNKDECMQRFRALCQAINKTKQQKD